MGKFDVVEKIDETSVNVEGVTLETGTPQGTSEQLHLARATSNTSGDTVNSGQFVLDNAEVDIGGMIDLPNNRIVIKSYGVYNIRAAYHVNAGGSNRQLNVLVNGVRVPGGFAIVSGGSQGDSLLLDAPAVILNVGDVITLTRSGAGSSQIIGNALAPSLTVEQIRVL